MKAPAFAYARPDGLPELFGLLGRHGEGARMLAGGQSLMATLNMRLSAPELLIDLARIDALKGIAVVDGVLRIGAMTRQAELERSALVARHAPLLVQALPHIAHPAIRNRGTIGGSLAFADPAAELPACAVALDAKLVLAGAGGTRRLAAAEFFTGLYRTALAPGEVLQAVELPLAPPDQRCGFLELARRRGDYALVGVAFAARMSGGRFASPRPVAFAAGATPHLSTAAARALDGAANTPETREAAAAALAAELDPPTDLNASAAMRKHLARVLLARLLEGLPK